MQKADDMTTHTATRSHVQVRVTGTLRSVSDNGVRALTADEFHDVMDRIAEHLDNEPRITDPCTWGQVSTGDTEICFVLADLVAGPELNQQLETVIRRIGEEVGLIWHTGSDTTTNRAAGTILAQKRQICELVAA